MVIKVIPCKGTCQGNNAFILPLLQINFALTMV